MHEIFSNMKNKKNQGLGQKVNKLLVSREDEDGGEEDSSEERSERHCWDCREREERESRVEWNLVLCCFSQSEAEQRLKRKESASENWKWERLDLKRVI